MSCPDFLFRWKRCCITLHIWRRFTGTWSAKSKTVKGEQTFCLLFLSVLSPTPPVCKRRVINRSQRPAGFIKNLWNRCRRLSARRSERLHTPPFARLRQRRQRRSRSVTKSTLWRLWAFRSVALNIAFHLTLGSGIELSKTVRVLKGKSEMERLQNAGGAKLKKKIFVLTINQIWI